jgi:CBS domain-containing protein/sporulation protein YlmC with PRC-barrel domain
MAYFSELISREVRDHRGALVGTLRDVLIVHGSGNGESAAYPRIVALQINPRDKGEPRLIPWEGTEDLAGNKIILQKPAEAPYVSTGNEIWLARDMLDKQVIDTNNHRVVRVNDLELGKIGLDYRLINVDIGGRGLLRRLGIEDFAERVAEAFNRDLPSRSVAWSVLDLLPVGGLRVQVPREHIKDLHPADIAEILQDVGPRVGAELIGRLDDEKAADTLEELDPEFQAQVLETLPEARAADIVEEMQPDEAADALNALDDEKRADIVEQMEPEEMLEVQELLQHGTDTAGGIMTNKFVTVPPGITCVAALQNLRANAAAKESETIYYVYVTDTDGRLIGVFSLSDLVLADPDAPVESIMHKKPITVLLDTPREEVLEQIAKYDLLAIPVLDQDAVLRGIVTSDDALEHILPQEWKLKLPRVFR